MTPLSGLGKFTAKDKNRKPEIVTPSGDIVGTSNTPCGMVTMQTLRGR